MANTQEKLDVLARIGEAFNGAGLTWAVGASLMLYFRGVTDNFHDIDLLATDDDAPRACELLSRMGAPVPKTSSPQFTTRFFCTFAVDGVDVDLMAGFGVVYEGRAYDRSLDPADITEFRAVNGVSIPLHSLAVWRENYRLMGRDGKVKMIDG